MKNYLQNLFDGYINVLLIIGLHVHNPLVGMDDAITSPPPRRRFMTARPLHREQERAVSPPITEAETPDQRGHILLQLLADKTEDFALLLRDLQKAEQILSTSHPGEININITRASDGKTALHLAVLAYRGPLFTRITANIIQELRRHSAALDRRDNSGRTAAQYVIDAYNDPNKSQPTKNGLRRLAETLGCGARLLDVQECCGDDDAIEESCPLTKPQRAATPHGSACQYHNEGDLHVDNLGASGGSRKAGAE